jgi:hypothetical protein
MIRIPSAPKTDVDKALDLHVLKYDAGVNQLFEYAEEFDQDDAATKSSIEIRGH